MITLLLVVILAMLLIGTMPTWSYSSGWGYYPSGGIALVLIIVFMMLMFGYL